MAQSSNYKVIHCFLEGSIGYGRLKPLESLAELEYLPRGTKYEDCMKLLLENKEGKKQLIAIIASTDIYDKPMLEAGHPYLGLIARTGIGVDNIDLESANELGIAVTNTPDAPTNGVAEYTIMGIIFGLRQAPYNMRPLQSMDERRMGREISECITGIVGCGRIGSLVAERLSIFNPQRILLYDVREDIAEQVASRYKCAEQTSLEHLISNSDVITLHVPLSETTRHLISEKEFNLMKSDVVLVNTARGGLIDESALDKYLITHPNAFAFLDVTEKEPYPMDGPLWELKNKVISPHSSAFTRKYTLEASTQAVDNVGRFFKRELLLNRVV